MEREKEFPDKEYAANFHRIKNVGGKILVTTDHGAWAILTKKTYSEMMSGSLDENTFELLEKKGIVITNRNAEQIIDDYRERVGHLFGGVTLHIIIPTLRCNQRCIYCHSAAKHQDSEGFNMDNETAQKALDFIFQSPTNSMTIEFQGGDGLLNYDLLKFIVSRAKEMNKENKKIRFALVTNLTLLTEEHIDWAKKEKVDICTSLDGPEYVHDYNRRYCDGSGTYKDVIAKLELCNKKGVHVGALMVTTKRSLSHWKEIIDEYIRWNILSVQIKYLNKLGFADDIWSQVGYTMEEFLEFWKKSVDYMIELNKKGIKVNERFVTLILQKILTKKDPSFLDFRNPCGACIGQLAYNYNGDVYSCDEGRNFEMFNLGNVKKDDYKKVVGGKNSLGIVSCSILENSYCDACVYKPFCGVCPVMSYAENNNTIQKAFSNSRCKLFKFQFDYVFEKLSKNGEEKDILLSWLSMKEH